MSVEVSETVVCTVSVTNTGVTTEMFHVVFTANEDAPFYISEALTISPGETKLIPASFVGMEEGIVDICANVICDTPSVNSISVISPNGGEIWQRGTTHVITWAYNGAIGSAVKIVLVKGGVEVGVIEESAPVGSSGSGSYQWAISSTATLVGSDFAVRIKSIIYPEISDKSDNNFTLTPFNSGLSLYGVQIFPTDNVWNVPVDAAHNVPVDPRSGSYISQMIANSTYPTVNQYILTGIPFNLADSSTPRQYMDFGGNAYSDVGNYPIPDDLTIEAAGGDAKALIVELDEMKVYELGGTVKHEDGSVAAGHGAIWDLNSNAFRKNGAAPMWSNSVAGTPVFSGQIRYDEVSNGIIPHALTIGVPWVGNSWMFPGRATQGYSSSGEILPSYPYTKEMGCPPAGQRFRLKASFDLTPFNNYPQTKVILECLKTYGGMAVMNIQFPPTKSVYAMSVMGCPNPGWNAADINRLRTVPASAFEAVDITSMIADPNTTIATNPALQWRYTQTPYTMRVNPL
jgi:hypothetical protein